MRSRREPATSNAGASSFDASTGPSDDVNAAAAVAALAPALALGSFLNVVAARVPARRSLLFPPSSCGTCESQIPWRDNIPVLSYFLLRGRCRHCSAHISSLYPAVEAATAVLAVACVAAFGPTAYAALAVGFCALLVTLSAIDIKNRIVSNRVPLVPFLSLGAVVALFFGERLLESYLGLF